MAARSARHRVPFAAILVAGVLAAHAGHAAPTVANEAEIKAQFFERFTRFIDWPEAVLPKGAPFVVCLAGGNVLALEIERRMMRTTVKGVATEIRRLPVTSLPDAGGCHALYMSSALRSQMPALMARTRNRPILTVSDTDGFSRHGVHINMFIEERFIRFEINEAAMRASGLKASSKLLRLARLVEQE